MIDSLDSRGRMMAQVLFSELEKIARFKINTVSDLQKARQTVADFAQKVRAEPRGRGRANLQRELNSMQNDLVDAEKATRNRGIEATQRYGKNPSQFTANTDEPDINEVTKLMEEINKNRTKRPGWIFQKAPSIPKPKKDKNLVSVPQANPQAKAQEGTLDSIARKAGYATLAGGAGYGGLKLYQAKKERDQMSQFGGGGMY